MIQFYNVSKIYDNGVKALNDVSLTIRKGEFLFLVGPSGAGKTSLIKLICREELASRGQVLLNGKNLARCKPWEIPLLRRKIGMVFQDFRLLYKKTAFENVAFALQIAGKSRKEINKSVPPVLEMVGLGDKANMMPAQLSGGEQQRACIARAIVNKPNILIADEPTGNLDPDTSWEIMKLFLDINRKGTTLIVSTHDREIVDTMKRRVIALSEGRLMRDEEKGEYGP